MLTFNVGFLFHFSNTVFFFFLLLQEERRRLLKGPISLTCPLLDYKLLNHKKTSFVIFPRDLQSFQS